VWARRLSVRAVSGGKAVAISAIIFGMCSRPCRRLRSESRIVSGSRQGELTIERISAATPEPETATQARYLIAGKRCGRGSLVADGAASYDARALRFDRDSCSINLRDEPAGGRIGFDA